MFDPTSLLCDLFDLLHADLAHAILVGLSRPLRQIDGALDEHRHGRGLGDESERTIGIDRDHDGNDQAFLILRRGLGVERLAELHDIDALRTERGADGRRGGGLAGRDLELYVASNFLCHCFKTPFLLVGSRVRQGWSARRS